MFTKLLFLLTSKALAAAPAIKPVGNPLGTISPTTVINSFYDKGLVILTTIAGALAVIFLVYYGIQYLTAGGNQEKTKMARSGVINAVIGIVIITAAFSVIRIATSIGSSINKSTGGSFNAAGVAQCDSKLGLSHGTHGCYQTDSSGQTTVSFCDSGYQDINNICTLPPADTSTDTIVSSADVAALQSLQGEAGGAIAGGLVPGAVASLASAASNSSILPVSQAGHALAQAIASGKPAAIAQAAQNLKNTISTALNQAKTQPSGIKSTAGQVTCDTTDSNTGDPSTQQHLGHGCYAPDSTGTLVAQKCDDGYVKVGRSCEQSGGTAIKSPCDETTELYASHGCFSYYDNKATACDPGYKASADGYNCLPVDSSVTTAASAAVCDSNNNEVHLDHGCFVNGAVAPSGCDGGYTPSADNASCVPTGSGTSNNGQCSDGANYFPSSHGCYFLDYNGNPTVDQCDSGYVANNDSTLCVTPDSLSNSSGGTTQQCSDGANYFPSSHGCFFIDYNGNQTVDQCDSGYVANNDSTLCVTPDNLSSGTGNGCPTAGDEHRDNGCFFSQVNGGGLDQCDPGFIPSDDQQSCNPDNNNSAGGSGDNSGDGSDLTLSS